MVSNFWAYLFTAVALLLVVEGILPFLAPRRWRSMMLRLVAQNDRTVRTAGLISMIIGAVLMYLVHSGVLSL